MLMSIFDADLFLANEVDLAMFTTLKDQDLKSIGVTSYRARRLMLHSIEGKFVNQVVLVYRQNCNILFVIKELKNLPISCPFEDYSRLHQFQTSRCDSFTCFDRKSVSRFTLFICDCADCLFNPRLLYASLCNSFSFTLFESDLEESNCCILFLTVGCLRATFHSDMLQFLV